MGWCGEACECREMRVRAPIKLGMWVACAWSSIVAHGHADAACVDTLVGDSIAEGIAVFGRPEGTAAVFERGRGIEWFESVQAGCARRLVIVVGTNDAPKIKSVADAMAYASRVSRRAAQWSTEEVTWVLPGCIDAERFAEHELGSRLLDEAAGAGMTGLAVRMWVVRTRQLDCDMWKWDGIHLDKDGYRRLWERVSKAKWGGS